MGVDEVDGNAWAHIVDESGSGIDIQRRADDDKDIGSLCLLGSNGDVRHGLAKEHDIGTQQRAIASLGARSHLAVVGRQLLDVARVVNIVAGAHLHQFTMQVDDLRRACLLVQVVDILRHHRHIVLLFEFCHQTVPLVGLDAPALFAQHVVEISHQGGVCQPALMCGHLLHRILFPQSVGIAESLQSTLHRHACTSQNNYLFHKLKY